MANLLKSLEQMLCPPGAGVHTVTNAREQKERLWKFQYPNQDPVQAWKSSLENITSEGPWLLGIPSDCGGGILRGANWGPLFLRETFWNLGLEKAYTDLGDVRVIPHLLHDKYLNQETILSCREALYGDSSINLPVSPLSITDEVLKRIYALNPSAKVFSLGGDHSVSYPCVKNYFELKSKREIKAGLIHFDAHTDLLDKRLGIDLCFGSWTYHVLPFMDDPSAVAQLGIRATGKDRQTWENNFGIKQYWPKEIEDKSPEGVAKEIVKNFQKKGIEEIYISFDIDVLDFHYASATGTPEFGGLAPDDCIAMIALLAQHFKVTGGDLMEVAPFVRHPQVMSVEQEPNSTLVSGASLAAKIMEFMS